MGRKKASDYDVDALEQRRAELAKDVQKWLDEHIRSKGATPFHVWTPENSTVCLLFYILQTYVDMFVLQDTDFLGQPKAAPGYGCGGVHHGRAAAAAVRELRIRAPLQISNTSTKCARIHQRTQ